MTTLPLIGAVRHGFVKLPEGRWLIEIGSPRSFGDAGSIGWAGRRRTVARRLGPIGMEQPRPDLNCPTGVCLFSAPQSVRLTDKRG